MASVASRLTRLPRLVLMGLVHAYRLLASPFPSPCRFEPSCSTYALQALETHGALKGSGLAIWRILRCNPFGKGGLDPVP